jgi:hypothetical protein
VKHDLKLSVGKAGNTVSGLGRNGELLINLTINNGGPRDSWIVVPGNVYTHIIVTWPAIRQVHTLLELKAIVVRVEDISVLNAALEASHNLLIKVQGPKGAMNLSKTAIQGRKAVEHKHILRNLSRPENYRKKK